MTGWLAEYQIEMRFLPHVAALLFALHRRETGFSRWWKVAINRRTRADISGWSSTAADG